MKTAPSPVIHPTIGRVVWFYPATNTGESRFTRHADGGGPYAAVIAHVCHESMVNLTVFDANGVPHGRTSVILLQDGVTDEPFCTWMPFQKGQAAKQHIAGQVEAMYSALQAADTVSAPFDFGEAIRYLKGGRRVARSGWNGKGQFAYLVPAASYPVQTGAAAAHFGEGSVVPYRAYLALKTVDDTVSTWAPSVSDVLAEDWVVVENAPQIPA